MVGEGTVKFSSRWLLNQLFVYLSPYMSYKCVHMKFGTILYRKGVDLLTSLSWALGTALHLQAHTPEAGKENVLIQDSPNDSTYKQRVLSEAGYIVNDLLQEEIRRQSSPEKENLHTDPSFLNIDSYLQDINPLLVHFITSATQTVRERLRSSLGSGHDTNRLQV